MPLIFLSLCLSSRYRRAARLAIAVPLIFLSLPLCQSSRLASLSQSQGPYGYTGGASRSRGGGRDSDNCTKVVQHDRAPTAESLLR